LLLFPPALFLYLLFSFIGRNHLIPPRTNTALPLIPLSRDYRTIPLSSAPTIHSPTHSSPFTPRPTQNPPTIPLSWERRTIPFSRDCRTIFTEPFQQGPSLILIWIRLLIGSSRDYSKG
jgi:hypothetical protein